MPTYFLAFLTALTAAASLTPAARRAALVLGMVDQPGPRKVHVAPTPLMGGVAVYLATIIAAVALFENEARSQSLGILIGGTLLLGVGLLDDRGVLHHQIKLRVAMPVAAIVLIASGVHSVLFSGPDSSLGALGIALDYALTFVWIVGITAAFSILDHMDGLCTGVAAVASAAFTVIAVMEGQVYVAMLAAVLLGASLGFLAWNFNPARIFLGDAGAMFLGFMMAAIGLKLRFPELSTATSWMIPVLVLGIPIFDTTLVTISRVRRGLVPFSSPGKDHFAHRLAALGLSHRATAVAVYGCGAVLATVALVTSWLPMMRALALFAIVMVAAVALIVALERAPYERQTAHA